MCPGCFSRNFNCCSGRVRLLLVLLSQRGKWEEVALMAESSVDVHLHPLLRFPRLVAVPHRAHEHVLPLIQRGHCDVVVLPAVVTGRGTAVLFADLQLLDAAGGPLSLPGGVW